MTHGESPPSGIRGVTVDAVWVEDDEAVEVESDDVDGWLVPMLAREFVMGFSRERRIKPFSRRMPRKVPRLRCFDPVSGRCDEDEDEAERHVDEPVTSFDSADFEVIEDEEKWFFVCLDAVGTDGMVNPLTLTTTFEYNNRRVEVAVIRFIFSLNFFKMRFFKKMV